MGAISHLLIGLGNPGPRYAATRHNIGFAMVDHLARRYDLRYVDSAWRAQMAEAILWQVHLLILKPQTFMNLSGTAVAAAAASLGLPAERLLIIHDDIDLPPGRIKIVARGGAGGHRGVQSIIDHLQTKDIPRIKVGVGRPAAGVLEVENYVLSGFSFEELALIERKKELVEKGIELFLTEDITRAMNFVNGSKENSGPVNPFGEV